MRAEVKKRLRRNRIIAMIIGAAVIIFCILMIGQIISSRNSNKEQDDLVSIIVPVYNVESRVEICLRSLLAQTYRQTHTVFFGNM